MDEIDRYVPASYRSRAEVVRVAVTEWIAERRAREVDAQYQRAYADAPPDGDDINGGRGQPAAPHPWDSLEW